VKALLSAELNVSVSAEAAILLNADTGAILFEKNAYAQYFPASITKVATALYALKEKGHQLNAQVEAEQEAIVSLSEESKRKSNYSTPAYWLEPGGTHIGIKKGELLSLKDLLYGMMLASGNDASNVIAQHVFGSIPKFIQHMNEFLKDEVGCKSTHFCNPHGLHHPDHQTTAYDMALITKEALRYPAFREMVSTVRYTRPKTNKQEPTTIVQSNKLLKSGKLFYSKAFGVKTGYTSKAQNTFVAAAKNEDRTLILVLLKSSEREGMFKDAIALFQAAFQEVKVKKSYIKSGPQKFQLKLEGASKSVATYLAEPVIFDYYPSEEPKVKAMLAWDDVELPVYRGNRVGEVTLRDEQGNVLVAKPLLASEDVHPSFLHQVKHIIGHFGRVFTIKSVFSIAAIIGSLFLFFVLFMRRR
jgi:D-alanyl-D-alanine carboxypeptidase (penicillin-binding protein 5/6)